MSSKKQTRYSLDLEDEVEMPFSDDDGDFLHSPRKEFRLYPDEEIISDDDEYNVVGKFSFISGNKNINNAGFHGIGSEKQDEDSTWSAINRETEALVRLNEHTSSSTSSAYTKSKKLSKGLKGKGKPKFSFHHQSQKREISRPSISKEEASVSPNDEIDSCYKVHQLSHLFEATKYSTVEHPKNEIFEDFPEEEKDQFDLVKVLDEPEYHGHNYTEHSMAELIDGLQDNTGRLRGSPKYGGTKGRRRKHFKTFTSTLGDRTFDNEDPPEAIGSGSSSNNEDDDQKVKLAIVELKGETMADRFEDALGASFINNEGTFFESPKTSVGGLFGKLQHVMQTEKKIDADFLIKLQSGSCPNDSTNCIDVKISSRNLDAKLTVCQCVFSQKSESLQLKDIPETLREDKKVDVTVIFNSRLCNDVELEVGNLIRIHFPWKEVTAIGHDEIVILSTYFSQIST